MNSQNVILSLGLIICFALLSTAQAVVPAPDGGYPGGNTAEGQSALLSLTTGAYNTAIGVYSLRSNSTANFNTGVGAGTLLANNADENTATGAGALYRNTTGEGNTANGAFALFSNTTGHSNTAAGGAALQSNTTGSANTAVGVQALRQLSAGDNNIAVGLYAGNSLIGGSYNIYIGNQGHANESSVIRVGDDNAIIKTFIAGILGNALSGMPVVITSAGQLVTAASSERFKKDIAAIDKASEAILSLRPVTFRYKADTEGTPQFGLVAEEVAKVNPALVVRDKEGKPYSVCYDAVNAMLLNEFLKEHKKVQEQQATIAELKSAIAQQQKDFRSTIAQRQKEMESVIARLNQQDLKINRINDQVQPARPAPQVAANDR
jgi:hypothetical protein